MGTTLFSNVQSAKRDRCQELSRRQICRNVTVSIRFAVLTRWKCGIRWTENNPIRISHVICHGTRYHQGARRQDMTATETFCHFATVLAQTLWCYGSFDHGPGHRIWCRLSTAVSIQEYLTRGD